MTLLQAGMLVGTLLSTWRPLPLCFGLAGVVIAASLAFAVGVTAGGLAVGVAFAATFPTWGAPPCPRTDRRRKGPCSPAATSPSPWDPSSARRSARQSERQRKEPIVDPRLSRIVAPLPYRGSSVPVRRPAASRSTTRPLPDGVAVPARRP